MSNQDVLAEIDEWLDRSETSIERLASMARNNASVQRWKGEDLRRLLRINNLQRVYDAETDGRLPPADRDERGQRVGYTLEQAMAAMRIFSTLPWRSPETDDPVILSFTNFKGGCWKTTSAHYFATWAATRGYRVLAVDLDPQASLTRNLGIMPDLETDASDTLAPFLVNQAPATKAALQAVVRKTHLCTLDLIAASLDLQSVEWRLSRDAIEASQSGDSKGQINSFLRLKFVISELIEDYDIIVIDGTPTLGLIPLNIILASDGVIVPVPTEIGDFCSTAAFLRMLHEQLNDLMQLFGDAIQFPRLQFLPTRFSPGSHATMGSEFVLNKMIRTSFMDDSLEAVIKKHDAVISNLGLLSRTAFDSNPGEGGVNRDARKRAIANYGQAFDEIMRKLVYPHWPSKQQELELREILYG